MLKKNIQNELAELGVVPQLRTPRSRMQSSVTIRSITMFGRESCLKPSFPTSILGGGHFSKSNEPNWETGKVAPCPAAHDQFHWSSQPSNKWREGLHFDKGIHSLCLSNWEKSNNPEKTPSLRHVWMYQEYIYNLRHHEFFLEKKKHLESSSEHESKSDEILPVGCDSLT